MHVRIKAAILLEITILITLPRQWTSVPIDALQVVTFGPEPARCHARDVFQGSELVFGRLISMIMAAVVAIRTIASQIVDVAHVYFLHPIDFVLVVVEEWVDTLAVFVTRDSQ